MEKNIIDVKQGEKELKTIFANEIFGYKTEPAQLSLIFDTKCREYLPGFSVIGHKGSAELTLISSPLVNKMVILNSSERYIPVSNVGAEYNRGYIKSKIVEFEGGLALEAEFSEPREICADAQTAFELINGYLGCSIESGYKTQYHLLPEVKIETFDFSGELCWGVELPCKDSERFRGILVGVAHSNVKMVETPKAFIRKIETGARYKNNNPATSKGWDMYFYNGKTFRLAPDDNVFMGIAEAKEVYENKPEAYRLRFAEYEDKSFAPATCCEDLVYIIAAGMNGSRKTVLLINAEDGYMVDFRHNVDNTVKYINSGTGFSRGSKSIILNGSGWAEYSPENVRP